MKKTILYALMFLLVIGMVAAEQCIPKEKFFDRLVDKCKYDNEICEDAESPLTNKDCALNTEAFSCDGDRCIFEEIWFAKLVIIALIFLLIKRKKDYNILIVIMAFYLVATFTPFDIIGEPYLIQQKLNTSVQMSDESFNNNLLLKYGAKLMPSNPIIGIIIMLVILFFIVKTLTRYSGRRWQRKR